MVVTLFFHRFSSQMWSQGGGVLPVSQYEGWGNCNLCAFSISAQADIYIYIKKSFPMSKIQSEYILLSPCFSEGTPLLIQNIYLREVFIKIVCFDWHIFVCFPTQDAMRLYYVCTAPHCGHRWTEWSLLIIKRFSTCFYAVAVSTRTVSIWVCVYSECIWLYKIAALLSPLLLLYGHSYLSPCCEYNVISFAVVLFF